MLTVAGPVRPRSASVYEHSTETLFFGRQDAMQRTSLLPIADFVREAGERGRGPEQVGATACGIREFGMLAWACVGRADQSSSCAGAEG